MTPRRCYIAGWRVCRNEVSRYDQKDEGTRIDPNKLPPELLEAWSTGFHDALVAPPNAVCDPIEAGYED